MTLMRWARGEERARSGALPEGATGISRALVWTLRFPLAVVVGEAGESFAPAPSVRQRDEAIARAPPVACGMPGRALISERHVRDALDAGLSRLGVPENALVTALARDLAADRGLALVPAAELAPAPAATNAPAPPPKTLALGCDHAGFEMKAAMRAHAESLGWTVRDVGTHSAESVDYPDFAFAVARLVQTGEVARGLMIDGVGV
ncbi:MAG TPA: RpiB/LacA/LacB family sugar-phosphate isomerase, partial [Rhodothermales bacterium]|nr:RpiB/LacA/LacB family sugar-phosphate isomerase [Rhodothermales bacterium]